MAKHTGAFTSATIDAISDRRVELRQSQEWIVDQIFPAGAMHLIGGPSGVGKTTWLFQMLYEWEQSLPLFGEYASHPVPWVYISCDRSIREMEQTLLRMGLQDWRFECYALEELIYNKAAARCDPPEFARHVLDKFKFAKLVVIEGLQAVMPDHSKARSQNKQELLWALEQRLVLARDNRTVIATTHSPKETAGIAASVSRDDRSKFLGTQGFIGSCSTMISLEKKPDTLQDARIVHVMGRNFKDIQLHYSMDRDGRFVLENKGTDAVPSETDEKVQFATWCQSQPEPFPAKDAVAYGMRMGVSDSTVERWLVELCDLGALERFKDGKRYLYRRKAMRTQ